MANVYVTAASTSLCAGVMWTVRICNVSLWFVSMSDHKGISSKMSDINRKTSALARTLDHHETCQGVKVVIFDFLIELHFM